MAKPRDTWRRTFRKAGHNLLVILFVFSLTLGCFDLFIKHRPLSPDPCSEELINVALEQFSKDSNEHLAFIFPCARAGKLNGEIVDGMRKEVDKAVAEWKESAEPDQPRARFVKAVVRYHAAVARYGGKHLPLVEEHVLSLYTQMAGRCLETAPVDPLKPFPTLICGENGEEQPEAANFTMKFINRIPLVFFFVHGEYSGPVITMLQNVEAHQSDLFQKEYEDLMRREEPKMLLEKLSLWDEAVQVDFLQRVETHLMQAMNRMANCNPFTGDDWSLYLRRSGRVTGGGGASCDFNHRPLAAALKQRAAVLIAWLNGNALFLKYYLYVSCIPLVAICFFPHDPHVRLAWMTLKVLSVGFLVALYCSHHIHDGEDVFVHSVCIAAAFLCYVMLASLKDDPDEEEAEKAE